MKRILFLTFVCLNVTLNAQTVFWTEGFGTSCSQLNPANNTTTSNGTWTVTTSVGGITDAAEANMWYISATEAGMGVGNCGSGCLTTATLTNRTLHISNVSTSPSAGFFCPTGDCGAAYDSGGGCSFGLGCVTTSDRAESPIINCTGMSTITLGFSYLEAGDPGNDFMQVMYSANGGTTWSSLVTPGVTSTSCGASQGLWTNFSVALPATANNNANVKIGFWWKNNDDGVGNDPSIAIDSIKLSVPTSTVTPLLTATITPSPTTTICQSSTVALTGSASGTVTAWSWSVTPSSGVAFSPSATSQSVTVTFTTSGTYTFVLTATGSGTATATQTITVLPTVVPSVSITANPGNPICAGQTVSFMATPTNGGSTPSYTWAVNGVGAGTNSPNFSSSTLNNLDVVSVTFTSNATCVSPATASASYTVLTSAAVTPAVAISPTVSICSGALVTFTATSTNGGSSPSYTWAVSGVVSGTNASTFTTSTLTNGAIVSVTLTSNAGCVTTTTASAAETVTVQPSVTPSVTINPPVNICSGTSVNFTATPTNGGTSPSYQWVVNITPVGTNSPNFSSSTLNNGDVVSVILTSNATCATSNTVSASETVTVTTTVIPTVSISANPGNPICAGQTVSFTATTTNSGGTPSYQWQVGTGNLVGTNSPNFSSSTLTSSDTVFVTLTSNAVCATPSTAIASYTIQVSTPQTPSVTISPNPGGACAGGSATFTANSTNGGSIPVYQWAVNGVSVPTGTASVFTTSSVVATETISVTLTSNAGCVSTNTASNVATVTITPTPTLSIIKNETNTVCPNAPDTIIAIGTPSATYIWTPAAGLNVTNTNTVVATNTALGIYTYYVTCTIGGCTSIKDSAFVTISNAATTIGSAYTICSGLSANLSASGGTTYTWTPSSTLSCSVCVNPVATPSTTTVYTVTTTSGACNSVTTNTVFVNPGAIASFGDSVTVKGVPQIVTFTNTSSNGTGYIWNFGDNSTLVQNNLSTTTHTFTAAGIYTVTLIAFSANGCNDTIIASILVIDSVGLTMPNIFTPNGDGINDYFAPNAHGMKTLSCTIYDRWGIKIVTLDNMNNAYWDGHTTSGIECTDGTYFYMVTATDINNKSYNLKGFLQLIR
jgi:gliding motility-associated-like protein